MHGDLSLGGPVWLLATTVLLVTLGLALFVFADSLRGARRRAAASRRAAGGPREPLWMYTAGEAAFLALLALTQVLPGISLVSAVPVIAMPLALVLGITYLLRVVFPASAAPTPESPGVDAPARPR